MSLRNCIWASAFIAQATMAAPVINEKISKAAMPWADQPYRVGQAEQCMNWTREVLAAACGDHFQTLTSKRPWDAHLLGPEETVVAGHADSLAADEFGQRIDSTDELKAGDLVFLKNTYGNWADGVYTHVGIATGDGNYIHRMTSNKGIVRVQTIPEADFAAGIRLNEELCQ